MTFFKAKKIDIYIRMQLKSINTFKSLYIWSRDIRRDWISLKTNNHGTLIKTDNGELMTAIYSAQNEKWT